MTAQQSGQSQSQGISQHRVAAVCDSQGVAFDGEFGVAV